ncbi:hypothetical protein PJ985_06430 [Streptomyces sp. ACA25]|uniref:hypothetical protein n=1 Tax=Streptomyces sp. ACA25 TaxID=3022596 RepID=UPI0023082F8C|nr:hypothetical protein [Streptomyces sp. ACA25]MDB1087205.1 hypothetical protein [Streptomyces sp. ACA25]
MPDPALPRPAVDPEALDAAVDVLADRLRRLPESALRRGAAADGLAVARELARRAQRLERPAEEPRELPEAGVFAVGDQVAVAGHDLAQALRANPAVSRGELTGVLELIRGAG